MRWLHDRSAAVAIKAGTNALFGIYAVFKDGPPSMTRGDRGDPPRNYSGPADYPITVRIERATQLTGIGRTKLYELIKSGSIKSVRIGRSRHIVVASLIQFINELPRG